MPTLGIILIVILIGFFIYSYFVPKNVAGRMEIMVPMRDGVELQTFVYLPEGEGPFPTLVARTIYGVPISPIGGELMDTSMTIADYVPPADGDDDGPDLGWPLITQNGYALVVQVTRGRFGSEGIDRTWRDDAFDGYDLVEWVNNQSWSNGKIGMFGDSAVGMSAALAASAQPPALDAIYLQTTPADPIGTDMAPRDGALRTESLLLQGGSLTFDVSADHMARLGITAKEARGLAKNAGTYVQDLALGLEDPLNSPVWTAAPLGVSPEISRLMPFWALLTDPEMREDFRNDTNVIGKIEVPTSVVTLWQDTFAESTLELFFDLEARGIPSELLVVNGTHYEIDDPRIFPQPRMLSWFDHWLKDTPAPERAKVTLATQLGDSFIEAETLKGTFNQPTRLFLGSNTLTTNQGPTTETSFVSDPANPVPTLGGRNLLAAAGATDHASLIGRPDTTVFLSQIYDKDTNLFGPIVGELNIKSDAPSFDASIRLLDQAPDGTATLILADHVRSTSENDGIAKVLFDMGEINHRLRAGHRLALMVAGSDFPAWDRNPQTGSTIFNSSELRTATLTVVTGQDVTSYIDLPLSN